MLAAAMGRPLVRAPRPHRGHLWDTPLYRNQTNGPVFGPETSHLLSRPGPAKTTLRSFAFLMADHVDDHGGGEDQDVVLTVRHFDSIGIGPAEPTFAHLGDLAAVTLERVFPIHE